MILNLFPWDNGEKPYWINPENELEWYVDKDMTDWCTKERVNNIPPLNAVVFFVCKRTGDEVNALSRILLCKKTNKILADEEGLEQMGVKIDMLRLAKSYDKK